MTRKIIHGMPRPLRHRRKNNVSPKPDHERHKAYLRERQDKRIRENYQARREIEEYRKPRMDDLLRDAKPRDPIYTRNEDYSVPRKDYHGIIE